MFKFICGYCLWRLLHEPFSSKLSLRLLTSNCSRRLFWFGIAAGKIEKNAQQIFFKEAKAAPVQLRSCAGCGGESFKLNIFTFFERIFKKVRLR
ncbi:hypothetical protein [Ferruginibacter albus]|uniref:hypothetical protein n=1 Tax=Ferruginibacter albus TaxID=2875540 RepID=UPI001CC56D26|nr:hypothetical protein [Ferruginibacter albus]UAY51199.1 hypothetical protein K9M53_11430 [Ferruginibacter albus]